MKCLADFTKSTLLPFCLVFLNKIDFFVIRKTLRFFAAFRLVLFLPLSFLFPSCPQQQVEGTTEVCMPCRCYSKRDKLFRHYIKTFYAKSILLLKIEGW